MQQILEGHGPSVSPFKKPHSVGSHLHEFLVFASFVKSESLASSYSCSTPPRLGLPTTSPLVDRASQKMGLQDKVTQWMEKVRLSHLLRRKLLCVLITWCLFCHQIQIFPKRLKDVGCDPPIFPTSHDLAKVRGHLIGGCCPHWQKFIRDIVVYVLCTIEAPTSKMDTAPPDVARPSLQDRTPKHQWAR